MRFLIFTICLLLLPSTSWAIFDIDTAEVGFDKMKVYSKQEAKQAASTARQNNNPDELYQLAFTYLYGTTIDKHSVDPNVGQAMVWLNKAAKNKHIMAGYVLGKIYDSQKLYTRSTKWYSKSAKLGFLPAIYTMGMIYEHGRGVFKSLKTAAKYFEEAADKGSSQAHIRLSQWHNSGKLYKRDINKALEHLNLAAEIEDNPLAIAEHIAGIYVSIEVTEEQFADKLKWLTFAATELDHMPSEYALAILYHKGVKVPQSFDTALKWYKLAATHNHRQSMELLGYMYDSGTEIDSDECEAMKWYNMAAEYGSAEASWQMGNFYFYGKCIDQDYKEAERWYNKMNILIQEYRR